MSNSAAFEAKHVHKDAGMATTIVVGGRPLPSPGADGLPEWVAVPHPPTADDPPIVILHLLRFHQGAADTAMVDYQQAAGAVAVPHGVRIAAWFAVEGTILGDGRTWDQVRFHAFPSRAAFFAVATDPERLAAQGEHRAAAIADTYTLLLRPMLDRLQPSLDA
jgi:hypothetical protein